MSGERRLSLDAGLRHSFGRKLRRGLGLWWSGEVPLRKLVNAGLCHLSLRLRLSRVLGKPFSLMIEPTNACNLRCPLCPTGRGTLGRPAAALPLDLYRACLRELGPYLMELNLTNYGEPMLHRDLAAMVAEAKATGARVLLGTNGHFLGEAACRQLVESGLDGIYISVDATDAETYAKYRQRGDFTQVLDGTRRLLAARQALGRANPVVELQFLVMKHNESQIDGFRALAAELGADRRIIKPVSFNVADWDDPGTRRTFADFFPTREEFRVYVQEGDAWRWKRETLAFCTAPWRTLTVLADGAIVPCCRDPRGVYTMGHIADGVLKVWNGPQYRAFRRHMAKHRDRMSICNICPGE